MSARAKILLVDDNRDNIFVLESLLTHEGYGVRVACNGAEAIAMAQNELPDLILMDLDMPVMNGWEASRRLKGAASTSMVPIIAVSAFALVGDEENAVHECCDDFVTKPFVPAEVIRRINRLLEDDGDRAAGLGDADG